MHIHTFRFLLSVVNSLKLSYRPFLWTLWDDEAQWRLTLLQSPLLLVKSSLNLYCVVITGMMGCHAPTVSMGRLAGQLGWRANGQLIIMECHDKLLAGKEACGYCQAGKQGEGNQRAFAIITAIGYDANKPQIMYWNPVTSLWCDMPRIVLFMSSLKAPWTQLCLLLHSESSHSHLCKPKQSSCLEQKTTQCPDKKY